MTSTAVVLIAIALGLGALLGLVVATLAARRGRAASDAVSEALVAELRAASDEQRRRLEESRDSSLQAALAQLVTANQALAEQQAKLGEAALGNKTTLIDQQLRQMHEQMNAEMAKVATLVTDLEKDRAQKFGQLAQALHAQNEQLVSLSTSAQSLREVLASQKVRGQWGERMAEDVLQLAGFVENVNYRKQKALEDRSGIPDYTFLLPHEMVVHMDVKFPLDNYVRYLESDNDLERKRFRDDFLRDVRAKVKELAKRDYDAGDQSVDCVLLFIPNEALYAFIHEEDRALLEEGLRHKVVLCSPATLFAVLAVIRQAADNFRLERTSNEILALLAQFKTQWGKYTEQMDKLGKKIDEASREYATLVTTRTRMLERPLHKIESLEVIALDEAAGTSEATGAVTSGGVAAHPALDA